MIVETLRDTDVVEPTRPDSYEILDGKIVECPPMSKFAAGITLRLAARLLSFVESRDLGRLESEALFQLPEPFDRSRKPDVMFFSYDRWPKNSFEDRVADAWVAVPDLAVEVVSPNDKADDLMEKVREYFLSGVRLVWVVYPRWGTVHVFDSFTKVRGLDRTDILDGGDILPGFTLPLATLLPEPTN